MPSRAHRALARDYIIYGFEDVEKLWVKFVPYLFRADGEGSKDVSRVGLDW